MIGGNPANNLPKSLLQKDSDGEIIEPAAAVIPSQNIWSNMKTRRDTKTRIIAGLIGCSFDELKNREAIRQRKLQVRWLLSLAAIVLVFLGSIVFQQNQVLKTERAAAMHELEQTKQAFLERSRSLILSAEGLFINDYSVESMALMLEAINHDSRYLSKRESAKNAILRLASKMRERSLFLVEEDWIQSIDLNSNNTRLAVGMQDGSILIGDVRNTLNRQTLCCHDSTIWRVKFSKDDKYLVSNSKDGTSKVWDVKKQKELYSVKSFYNMKKTSQFLPEKKLAVILSNSRDIGIYDLENGRELEVIIGTNRSIDSLVYNEHDSTLLAIGFGGLQSWDINSYDEVFHRPDLKGKDLTVHPKFNQVVYDASGQIMILNLTDLSTRKIVTPHRVFRDIKISPGGTKILARTQELVNVYDFESGNQVSTISSHSQKINVASFLPRGWQIATGSDDDTIKISKTATGEEIQTLKGHESGVYGINFINENLIVSRGADKTIRVWDIDMNDKFLNTHEFGNNINRVKYHKAPDLATISLYDNETLIWNVKEATIVDKIVGHAATFSYDASFIAASNRDDNSISIWDAKALRKVKTLEGHTSPPVHMEFSDTGTHLISIAPEKGEVYLWTVTDIISKMVLNCRCRTPGSAHFSKDGKFLVLSENYTGSASVWEVSTGKFISRFKAEGTNGARLVSSQFSDDGEMVLSIVQTLDYLPVLKIWNPQLGTEISTLSGHTDSITSASFFDNGQKILSSSKDNSTKIWKRDGSLILDITGPNDVWDSKVIESKQLILTIASDEFNSRKIDLWDLASGENKGSFGLAGSVYDFVGNSGIDPILSYSYVGNELNALTLPYLNFSELEIPSSRRSDNEFSLQAKYVFAAGAKVIPYCMNPSTRKKNYLTGSPPCWCQEKVYPTMEMWEDDFILRNPELDLSDENGKWPNGVSKPNPFLNIREDGWTCPPKGEGYSAPWNDFEDLKTLSSWEILGPANSVAALVEK